MNSFLERLERAWCKAFHPAPMWPIHGRYRCPSCLREYPVAWSTIKPVPVRQHRPVLDPLRRLFAFAER